MQYKVLRYIRYRNPNMKKVTNYFWPWAAEQVPGDPAAHSSQPPCCHLGQDEVVEDDEDEYRGDDGGCEGVD